jgi:hypothetical protein
MEFFGIRLASIPPLKVVTSHRYPPESDSVTTNRTGETSPGNFSRVFWDSHSKRLPPAGGGSRSSSISESIADFNLLHPLFRRLATVFYLEVHIFATSMARM